MVDKKIVCKVSSLFTLKRNRYWTSGELLGWWWVSPHKRKTALAWNLLSQQNPLAWAWEAIWFPDLCCKRDRAAIFSTPETHSRLFIPSHLAGSYWRCTATHVRRNIYYPSSFIVTVFSSLVTTSLSPAEAFGTSQRLTAAPVSSLACHFIWHILRGTLRGHLDKYNSFLTSGKVAVFLGPSVGNEGCMGFQAEEKPTCKEQRSGKWAR